MTENNPDHPGEPGPAAETEGTERRVCAGCGAVATGAEGLTWLCSVENGARRYFCTTCSRTHLRAIEGRLDSTWW